MEWINIKDHLPPVDEYVLLCGKGTITKFGMETGFYMNEGRVLKEGFWTIRDGTAKKVAGVTHWMPLPEPPK